MDININKSISAKFSQASVCSIFKNGDQGPIVGETVNRNMIMDMCQHHIFINDVMIQKLKGIVRN